MKKIICLMTALFLFVAAFPGEKAARAEENNSAKEYVFEAEWSDCIEELAGFDYSGTISGLDMIQKDYYDKQASNGFYVTGLYGEGLALRYVIRSDRHVEDAILSVRLSAEYMDIVISPSNYTISINGNSLSYRPIKLVNVPVSERSNMLEFQDFTLTSKLTLEEGENEIIFETTNNTPMMGTMYATAPLVDCFKITTSAELSWEPWKENTGM